MTPSLGNIVNFKDMQSNIWPAIVTKITGNSLSLTVFKTQEERYTVSALAPNEATAREGQCWLPEVSA